MSIEKTARDVDVAAKLTFKQGDAKRCNAELNRPLLTTSPGVSNQHCSGLA